LNVARQGLDEPSRLDTSRPELLYAAKKLRRRRSQGRGDLLDGGERGVAAAGFDGSDVVWRQLRALGQLLEREPKGLSPAPNRIPELHGLEVGSCMPVSTTIGGVANQLYGGVS
jgi:hypothetical protein